MAITFYTPAEGSERIATLNAAVIARGGVPYEGKPLLHAEFRDAIQGLESQLETLPPAAPPPLPEERARLERKAALEAATLRLEASQARLAAAQATLAARDASAAAKAAAAAPVSKTPHLDKFESLSGSAATAYYAEHGDKIRGENQLAQVIAANPEASVSRDAATGVISISHRKN